MAHCQQRVVFLLRRKAERKGQACLCCCERIATWFLWPAKGVCAKALGETYGLPRKVEESALHSREIDRSDSATLPHADFWAFLSWSWTGTFAMTAALPWTLTPSPRQGCAAPLVSGLIPCQVQRCDPVRVGSQFLPLCSPQRTFDGSIFFLCLNFWTDSKSLWRSRQKDNPK